MVAMRAIDLRNDFKRVSNLVNEGNRVLIARPHNQNIVVISEKDYNELEKAQRNMEYMAMLEKSVQELADGKVVVKTMDELEIMAQ
jgi:antitoxin YefM